MRKSAAQALLGVGLAPKKWTRLSGYALTTEDHEVLIATALAGGGVIRTGMFGPAAIATGQLKRRLGDWNCSDAPSVYALYRKTARLAPKISAFLDFVAEAFALFDPEELPLIHLRAR